MKIVKNLTLSFGLAFDDLYSHEGLAKIDSIFLKQLEETAPPLHERLIDARRNPSALAAKSASELIVELAPYVEDFTGTLFRIEPELRDLQARHHELAPLYSVKRKFVQRKALTGYTAERAAAIDGFAVAAELEAFLLEPLTERSFANHVERWSQQETENAEALRLAALYAAWATLTPEGKANHRAGILFKTPHKLDMHHLVPAEEVAGNGLVQLQFSSSHWRHREGFQLTDAGMDLTGALDQAH